MEDLKSNAEMAESVLQPHLVEQQHKTRRLAFVALRNARVMFVHLPINCGLGNLLSRYEPALSGQD